MMEQQSNTNQTQQSANSGRSLTSLRRSTRLALWLEQFMPSLVLAFSIMGLFAALSWFGVFRFVPDAARYGLLVLFGLFALLPLYLLSKVRGPSERAINDRLELDNALTHQPVSVQEENLAGEKSAFADALWQAHRKRQADQLRDLKSATPKSAMPARDPFGLRAGVVLLAFAGFLFSFGSAGGLLSDAFRSHSNIVVVPPRIDAWVTPPAYTNIAPIFLADNAELSDTQSTTVPAGSTVLVRVTGGNGSEQVTFEDRDGGMLDVLPEAPDGRQASSAMQAYSVTLKRDGIVRLTSGDSGLRDYAFTVVPDAVPTIAFVEPSADAIKRAANGALELYYEAQDDFGLTDGKGVLSLVGPKEPGMRPLYEAPELGLALPRGAEARASTSINLTDHPWAGQTVELTLDVTDASGQVGTSDARTFVLPSRPFTNPLARAVVEERRRLALDATQASTVVTMLDMMLLHAETFIDDAGQFLALTTARSRVKIARDDAQYRDAADYLWDIALNIENGDLTDAERALQEAQQALRDALQNGASEEEIAELVDQLRQAMNDFLREFAERAIAEGQMQQMPPNSQQQNMEMSDLDRMLDQIEDLAEQGARDQAEQLLSQLENMLNNLQMGQQQQAGQQGQQGESQMQQQLNELGEILQQQQELMDQTMQAQRDQQQGQQEGQQGEQGQQGQQGEQGQQGQQPGQQPGQQRGQQGQSRPGQNPQADGQGLRQLQEGQGQLQQRLQDMMQGLGQMGMEPSNEFAEGEGAMGRAGDALGEGEGGQALSDQADALDALRRGAQGMMEQMQQMQQEAQGQQGQQGGSEPNGTARGNDTDPLGRPRATTGPDFGNSIKVPDEIEIQRAREILEAIRRRLGDALSPELEKQYLERLLDFNR